jgi:hypothetical protein
MRQQVSVKRSAVAGRRKAMLPQAVCLAAVLAAAAVGAAPAQAGPSAAQKCEGGKNQTAGKYAACVAKAEKSLVTKGDVDGYLAALLKCSDKLDSGFTKLEDKGDCPTTDDAAAIEGFHDFCAQAVAQSLADGTPLPDSGGGLLVTGQTTSYGAGTDGDLQLGTARSFTDNGDGTITDNVTGLMWEKKSDDGSVHDKDNLYTWSTGTDQMDGTIVMDFLATLNGGGGFAGYTDWRIPNQFELYSLVNLEVVFPVTYAEFNDSCTGGCTVTTCSCTESNFYWSSSTYQNGSSFAWSVDFSVGLTGGNIKTNYRRVRAVRAGS